MAAKKTVKKKDKQEKRIFSKINSLGFEILCGIFLALFAAILAVTDLGAGKYGDDEIIAHNEKTTAYQWFNSKGMKQNIAEGQRDILNNLLIAGVIAKDQTVKAKTVIDNLDKEIKRYDREKTEILLGSEKVGKDNWVQNVDGQMGQVIGAKQWEDKAAMLGSAGDVFDLSILFLQLCMVIGAVSLVLKDERLKWTFFAIMIMLGSAGSIISVFSYLQAFKIPALG